MTKKEIQKALSQTVGGAMMMSPAQLAAFLGKNVKYVQKRFGDLDHVGDRKGKMYFVGDVADRIMEIRSFGA